MYNIEEETIDIFCSFCLILYNFKYFFGSVKRDDVFWP